MEKRKRLVAQLYPTYLLIAFVSLIAVTWYAFDAFQGYYLDQMKESLTAQANLIKEYIKPYQSKADNSSIDRICKQAGKASDTRITIVRPSGKVIGDSEESPESMENHGDRPEIVSALQNGTGNSIRYSGTLDQKMMYVAVAVRDQNMTAMVVRTSLPVTSIYGTFNAVRARIFVAGIVIALLVALISLFISRKIAGPIREMQQGAERFAAGRLDTKLHIPESEELAGLAIAMNNMADQLNDRIKTVIRQTNELEAVFSSMNEGVIAVGNDEKVLRINRTAESLLGSRKEQIQGKALYKIIRNHAFQQFTQTARSSDKADDDIVFEINEENHILNVKSAALIDETSQRIGTLFMLNDVTRIRRLEQMRRDFAANVSHEIKTPLTSIQGFAEALMAEPAVASDETATHYLSIIIKNASRLSTIVEDVLKLSEIEHADRRKDFNFQETRIGAVFNSAANICRSEAEQKNITIDIKCPDTMMAFMDFSLMELAAVNLLENAVKYSNSDSVVKITAEKSGNDFILRFVNVGVAIPEEHIPRLFERFYRVDKARSREVGGTGLGLAIVKHIVQIHGGRTDVKSKPGKETVFTVTLPCDPDMG
ncbi:MAG: ATP-binding protein [Thermodesulfobacteriota bacterium]|nr:ATP-binding protein [Thermodesulfobacteriota bacterium]